MNLRKTLHAYRPESLIIPGLILLGLALRLRQYLLGRSLWLDEAMLALNLIERNYTGLFQQLSYNQGGPVAFLLAEKWVISWLGLHDASLRLLPFLAGCAALIVYALLLRQVLGKAGTWLALGLFSIGVPLIYYSSEVKQYSSDVFIAVLLLWLAGGALLHPEEGSFPGRHKYPLLAGVGALALWFSHPALFVLAGVGTTLLLHHVLRRDWPGMRKVLGVIAVWAASFVLLYLVSLRGLASDQFLHDYWADSFMPLPPWANPGWFFTTLQGVIASPAGLGSYWPLPAALMLIGLAALLRQRWQFGAFFGLTLLATLAASELQIYPFSGRMILFSAPILLALTGAGLEAVSSWSRDHVRLPLPWRTGWSGNLVALVLAGCLLYQPLMLASDNLLQPNYGEHIRPAMAFLQANRRPGDKIYVYYWAVPAFLYYAPFYGITPVDFDSGTNHQNDPQGLLAEVDQYKGNRRVWIVFSHVYEKAGFNEMDFVLAHLNDIGSKRREYILGGSSVYLYLYDLSQP